MAKRKMVLALCMSLVAGGLAGGAASAPAHAAVAHPFLLVSAGEYTALQQRASAQPWATWKAGAISRCAKTYTADPDGNNSPTLDTRVRQMAEISGSCSLAYILDGANRSVHRAKILSLIDAARTDIYPDMLPTNPSGSRDWDQVAGASGAFFHLVVALDVIYPDLTTAQAGDAEGKLNPFGEFFYTNRTVPWEAAPIGGYGIWSIFQCGPAGSCSATSTHGKRITESLTRLRAHLAEQSSSDGAYLAGPNYAGHRMGSAGDRDTKSYYPDVLTRTGYHDFYHDPAYVKYIEHLTGYVLTPVRRKEPSFLRPEADAFVQGGSNGNTRHGTDDMLMVKDDPGPDYDREAYLRFNLAGYKDTHGNVDKALLRLGAHNAGSAAVQVEIRTLADDGWSESTITWNNRPTASTALGTLPSQVPGTTRELDVTALVNQVLADSQDSKLSVRIVPLSSGSDSWIQYGSREHANSSLRPMLVLRSAGDPVERDQFTFGDSGTTRGALYRSARMYSASRFGPVAAANAGWGLDGVSPDRTFPLITAYVLTTDPPETGTTVPSKIFRSAGAWFHEPSNSANALAGALWNATKETEHQHKETNALHLTAYGEHVLRNTGYNGWGNSVGAFTHGLMRGRAVLNNTVLLDYDRYFTDQYKPSTGNDHALRYGAGVTEGFTSPQFDYASGDSGSALPNGKHWRNFTFVHPSDGANGYWVVFDEVDATSSGVPASVAWHPNSATSPTTVTSLREYTSTVSPNPRTANNVKLTMFLGTTPSAVSLRWGPLGDSSESFQGRYLYASYPTDSAGRKNIVTVLFPSDQAHAKATMTRLSGTGYTGAGIAHPGGPADYALESNGGSTITSTGASWRGLSTHYRIDGSELIHYFVRKGRSFTRGEEGFSSPSPVSVYLRDKTGQIANSTGATVNATFRYPGINGVKLNGAAANVISSGVGWVTVAVPAGTRSVELVAMPSIS